MDERLKKLRELEKQLYGTTELNDNKVEDNSDTNAFSSGFGSAIDETQGALYGLVGLAGAGLGIDSVRDYGFEGYQRNMEEAGSYTRRTETGEDKYSWDYLSEDGDIGDWFSATGYYLGKGAGNLAGGGIAGLVGKQVAKQGLKAGVKGATAGAIATAGTVGATAGVASQAVGLSLGSTYGQAVEYQQELGNDIEDVNLGKVATFGTAAGAVEFGADLITLGMARMFKATDIPIVSTVLDKAAGATQGRNFATAGAKGALITGVTEGSTEVVQTILERLGADMPVDFSDPEFQAELKQAGFAGAMAGGGIGGAVNAITGRRKREEVLDTYRPEVAETAETVTETDTTAQEVEALNTGTEASDLTPIQRQIGLAVGTDRAGVNEADLTKQERQDLDTQTKQTEAEYKELMESFVNMKLSEAFGEPDTDLFAYNFKRGDEFIVVDANGVEVNDPTVADAMEILAQKRTKPEEPNAPVVDEQGEPKFKVVDANTKEERFMTNAEYLQELEMSVFQASQNFSVDTVDQFLGIDERTNSITDDNVDKVRPARAGKEGTKRRKEVRQALLELDDPSGIYINDPKTQMERELTVKEAIELDINARELQANADAHKALTGKTLNINKPKSTVLSVKEVGVDGKTVNREVTAGTDEYTGKLQTNVKTLSIKKAKDKSAPQTKLKGFDAQQIQDQVDERYEELGTLDGKFNKGTRAKAIQDVAKRFGVDSKAIRTMLAQTKKSDVKTEPDTVELPASAELNVTQIKFPKRATAQKAVYDFIVDKFAKGEQDDIIDSSGTSGRASTLSHKKIKEQMGTNVQVDKALNGIRKQISEQAGGIDINDFLQQKAKAKREAPKEAATTPENVSDFAGDAPAFKDESVDETGSTVAAPTNTVDDGSFSQDDEVLENTAISEGLSVRSEGKGTTGAVTGANIEKGDLAHIRNPKVIKQLLSVGENLVIGKSYYESKNPESKKGFDDLTDSDKARYIYEAQLKLANDRAEERAKVDAEAETDARPEDSLDTEKVVDEFMTQPAGALVSQIYDALKGKLKLPEFKELPVGLRRMIVDYAVQSNGVSISLKNGISVTQSGASTFVSDIKSALSEVRKSLDDPEYIPPMKKGKSTGSSIKAEVMTQVGKPDGVLTVLNDIADRTTSSGFRLVARQVEKRLRDLQDAGVKLNIVVIETPEKMARMGVEGALGFQTVTGNTVDGYNINIVLKGYEDDFGSGLDAETFVHEAFHGATHATIRMLENGLLKDKDLKAAYDALEGLRKELSAKFEESGDTFGMDSEDLKHALSNVDELLAYTYTSETFNNAMRRLEDSKKPFIKRIYQAVTRLLRMPFVGADALAQASTVARDIKKHGNVFFDRDAVAVTTDLMVSEVDSMPKRVEARSNNVTGLINNILNTDVKSLLKKGLLGGLTLEQIRTEFKLPEVSRYVKVLHDIQRDSKDRINSAHSLNKDWEELGSDLDKSEKKRLDKELDLLMIDATMNGFDPTQDSVDNDVNQRIMDRFMALPVEYRDMFARVRDYYKEDLQTKIDLFEGAVLEAQANGSDTTELEKTLASFKQVKGPYFPLKRLGKFYSVGMSPELKALEEKKNTEGVNLTAEEQKEYRKLRRSPKHYRVESYNYEFQAKERADEMRAEFGEGYYNEQAELFGAEAKEIPNVELIEDYFTASGQFDANQTASIREILGKMYADLLPDASGISSTLRRENIAGADTDMRQVFAQVAIGNAHRNSRMKHARTLAEATADVKKLGDNGNREGRILANELAKRNTLALDTSEGNPMINNLVNASYFAHLGASASYLFLNSTQVPMITLPWLSARYDTRGASAAIFQALKESSSIIKTNFGDQGWTMEFDWSGTYGENSGESRMLTELLNRNKLDITIEHDLAAVADGNSFDIGGQTLQKTAQFINTPVRLIEIANRASTGIAAYRLHMAKLEGSDFTAEQKHERAVEVAVDAVNETQLDYSSMNTPRFMASIGGSKSAARMVFQFRKYQQGLLYLLGKSMRDAVKGDNDSKRIARRTLAGLFTTTGTMAGAAGLPFAGSAFWIYNTVSNIFGEDDEPMDAETEFRNFLTDTLGDADLARVAMKGVPTLIGTDISNRIGLGDIASIVPFARSQDTAGETVKEWMFNLAGAPVSYAVRVADGVSLMADGDMLKGMEKVIPVKGIQNAIKGYRMSDDGITDSRGEPIFEADEFDAVDIALQSLGFATTKSSDYYDATGAIMKQKRAVETVRAELIAEYAQAKLAKDRAGIEEARKKIKAFNRRHKQKRGVRITPKNLNSSIRNRYDSRRSRDEFGLRTDSNNATYRDVVKYLE